MAALAPQTGCPPPVQCEAVPQTETVQFNLAKAFDTLVETLADRECIVWRDRRLSYGDLQERSRRLGSYLHSRGLGVHRERADLKGWESGQDHVALALYNGNEYLEGMLGSYRARVAPFNVNYRYVGEELQYLLNDAKPNAMILHSSLAPTLAEVLPTLDSPPEVLLQVEDESGNPLLPGAVWYEEALAASSPEGPPVEPSPDDLYVLYTGGTTGMPKGVLWRQHDIFMAAMGGRQVGSWKVVNSYEELTERLAESFPVRLMILPPLMHGAAQWACFMLMATGATLIFPDDTHRVDPPDVWAVVEREKANSMTIVGDAVLRPLLMQLDKKSYDLSAFFAVGNGGAPLTPAVRAMAVERIPNLVISDSAGSSETGAQMHVTSMDDVAVGSFLPGPGTLVVDETLSHVLEPGHEGNGWLAQTGNVPLGYLGDPEKTARTFPVIAGRRYSIPGDRARHRADGQIELLGRDSVTVNSGGEKIFVEEVERAIAGHPAVADVVVTGRPSERWGQEVVAVVQLADGAEASAESVVEEASAHIARYKLPKAVVFVDVIQRSPSGKADYRWAAETAVKAADGAGTGS
jgi:acyl-CoA synthetase (AMP-forming)/AMP-acid ligase II